MKVEFGCSIGERRSGRRDQSGGSQGFDGEAIEAGTPVEIFEVDGTTVVVYPKEP